MKEIRKEVDYRETPESKYVFMSRQTAKIILTYLRVSNNKHIGRVS